MWRTSTTRSSPAACRKAFEQIVGGAPAEVKKRRRYPLQPNEQALGALPTEAIIELEEGSVAINLFPDVAPVTIARFAALVTEGAYNNRTFHRVVPNFVVQGGSPGANEYAGTTPRYMRDEVGPQASHIRGAVGISTRGRDTGDGQIFIDLVDVPRLDRGLHGVRYRAIGDGTGGQAARGCSDQANHSALTNLMTRPFHMKT